MSPKLIEDSVFGLSWLSIWDEETEAVSMNTDHAKLSVPSKPQSPSGSPTSVIRKRRSSIDYELKNAHDALVGSVAAVINFLKISGVPKPR